MDHETSESVWTQEVTDESERASPPSIPPGLDNFVAFQSKIILVYELPTTRERLAKEVIMNQ